METTPALGLPLVAAAQAQKHVTVNEAVTALDALLFLAVKDRDASVPPAGASAGDRYIVGPAPGGAWSARAGQVALFVDGGWRFFVPRAGWLARVLDEQVLVVHDGGAWVPVLTGIGEIQNLGRLGVGTAADGTNPLAVKANAELHTARTAGEGGTGDLRVALNKEAASNTSSLLFQRGYSGRAEIGLVGSDDLAIKVSPDGTSWTTALLFDRATGKAAAPNLLRFDAAQTLAAVERAQARRNVGACSIAALAADSLVLNGSMLLSQDLGSSAVTVGAGAQAAYALDQWGVRKTGPSVLVAGQSAESVPPGFAQALKLVPSTAQAAIGSDAVVLRQPIEGARFARCGWGTPAAQPLAWSLWLRAPVAGSYALRLGNAAGDAAISAVLSCPSADTWTHCAGVFAAQGTGTWNGGSGGVGAYLDLVAAAAGQANAVAGTGAALFLTGVTLIPGDAPQPAETSALLQRPPDAERASCMRFFEGGRLHALFHAGAASQYFLVRPSFRVPKAAAPTMSAAAVSSGNTATATLFAHVTPDGFSAYRTTAAAGLAEFMDDWKADARLPL